MTDCNFSKPARPPNKFPAPARPPNNVPIARHPATSRASFLASHDDIPAARDGLETWLLDKTPDPRRRADIVLAANELFVNAFEHGAADAGCLVDMRRLRDQLVLTVTNSATDPAILPAEWWIMPGASEPHGRGLAIVKTIADDVTLQVTATSVSITAIFRLGPRTTPIAAMEAKLAR